jgi:hypothetical protein
LKNELAVRRHAGVVGTYAVDKAIRFSLQESHYRKTQPLLKSLICGIHQETHYHTALPFLKIFIKRSLPHSTALLKFLIS